MQTLVTKIPHDSRIRLEFALLYRSASDYPDALTQIHIAEEYSPVKQGIIIEEGIEDTQSGNVTAAAAAFNKAYQLDTSFADVAVYSAAGSILTGHVQEGKALLQQAYGTTTVDQDIILLAYYQIKDYPDFVTEWVQRVKDQGNSAQAEFGLAAALVNDGQPAAARALIQKTMTEHPEAATQGAAMLAQLGGK